MVMEQWDKLFFNFYYQTSRVRCLGQSKHSTKCEKKKKSKNHSKKKNHDNSVNNCTKFE